ncbi:hypothetical protein F7734_51935 [Scytonema sp. UIC 10036]|nr:hypothetical protein [Scytonema sp. UIC 10036]MUH00337.1 hypothetical protein [Scytonema sp. UIC 10036]
MSRNKSTTQCDRLTEVITRVDASTNTNNLKVLEPQQPIVTVKEQSNA